MTKAMTQSATLPRMTTGKPSLPAEMAERVRAALRTLVAQLGTITAVADAVDRSQASISNILSGKNEPSFETAQFVADAIGVDVFGLLAGRAQDPDDPWPNRTLVMSSPEFLAASGDVREKFVSLRREEDPTAPDWSVVQWSVVLFTYLQEERLGMLTSSGGREVKALPPKP